MHHFQLNTPLCFLKNMYSCIFFLPLSPSHCQSISVSTLPSPRSALYLNIFPLTIHPSIRREGLKSRVTVQSGLNWWILPALLGWREWMRRAGRGEKEITAERRAFKMERWSLTLFTLCTFFLFLHSRLAIDFSPSFTVYFSHSSVCLPVFPPFTSSTHSFFIYQTHSSTNSLWGLNINVAETCQSARVVGSFS